MSVLFGLEDIIILDPNKDLETFLDDDNYDLDTE